MQQRLSDTAFTWQIPKYLTRHTGERVEPDGRAGIEGWPKAGPYIFCVALVGVPLYLLASEVRVMLSVDGRREAVVTRASTVEGLLSARDVEVDPHDHVKPGLTSGLRDGLEVQVLRARPIQLDLNGNITTVWSTKTTVSGIMEELDLKADLVKPARSARLASGATLVLRDAHAVTVVHDGVTDSVVTTAGTVRQLLEHMKVAVGPVDEVTPGLDTAPVASSTVAINESCHREDHQGDGCSVPDAEA